ncbi:DUF3667 domain-containing protein [Kordiimonas sp.]|uniref:DUF3667 domain-containing protein n=1 Tax=Kordiimonas sp. TaxID=1970157 RepID=UPI003A925E33
MSQPVDVIDDTECRNCGAVLTGKYCSACGQRSRGVGLDAGELASEALDSIVKIDGKLWRTFLGLTKNPGLVAKNYAQGKRARYVNPLRYCFAAVAISIAATIWTGEFDAISESLIFVQLEGAANDPVVQELNTFLMRYLNIMSLLTVPVYAFVLMLLTRRSGYSYASHFSFVCYVVGQGALLGVLGTFFNSYVYFLGILPSLMITNFVYIYGAMRFYGRGIWASTLLISTSFFAYMVILFAIIYPLFILDIL